MKREDVDTFLPRRMLFEQSTGEGFSRSMRVLRNLEWGAYKLNMILCHFH